MNALIYLIITLVQQPLTINDEVSVETCLSCKHSNVIRNKNNVLEL